MVRQQFNFFLQMIQSRTEGDCFSSTRGNVSYLVKFLLPTINKFHNVCRWIISQGGDLLVKENYHSFQVLLQDDPRVILHMSSCGHFSSELYQKIITTNLIQFSLGK